MNVLHKFDALAVKAKAEWRRTLADDNATAEDRRAARVRWRGFVAKKDRALAIRQQARANRRKLGPDRRRSVDSGWQDRHADRRKEDRSQGRRQG